MRGTVIKRGNTWQAMWYTHRTIDGKRERKTKSGFHTKKEAERFLRQQIEDVESTIYTKTTRCTVGAYLLNWLEEYSRNLEQNTINGYRNNIENHIRMCFIKSTDIYIFNSIRSFVFFDIIICI